MHLRRLRIRRASAAEGSSGHEAPAEEEKTGAERLKEAGQIIAIFALMLVALIGLVGIAIDVTYAWREELRVQRAADAAALAGVVYLPADVSGGITAATAEAGKNGFSGGVSASQNVDNNRRLDVTVTASVPTFFLRALGINSFTITRDAHAVYILPVPMGSPDNFYGVFGTYKICSGTVNSSGTCSGTTTNVTQVGPSGQAISARGLWGSMLSQGAATQNGDAYLPTKNVPGSGGGLSTGTSPQHSDNYYDYAIELAPGATATVYIFDPGFCATSSGGDWGAGDKWFPSNSSSWNAVSAYYYLYNTNNQPYNPAAHTLVASSGSLFADQKASDVHMGGPATSGSMLSCAAGATTNQSDGRYWHMKWWGIATVSGGATGATYRLRTTSLGATNQQNADACNQFSVYVQTTGGTARVYGIGAMQMYTPLLGGTSAVFYLAQIDAQSGAGKTVEINLWDPGDTGQTARLKILQPTTSGWSAVGTLTWTARRVTSAGSNCTGGSGAYIETSSGTSSNYNGCWVTIDIAVPTSYAAPQDGWWKIQYDMLGSSGTNATDETTWQVDIRGNPVHLIP